MLLPVQLVAEARRVLSVVQQDHKDLLVRWVPQGMTELEYKVNEVLPALRASLVRQDL